MNLALKIFVPVVISIIKLKQLRLLRAGRVHLLGLLECPPRRRHIDPGPVEQLDNAQDLNSGILAAPGQRLVKAGGRSLFLHLSRGWLQGDEDPDGSFFTVEHTPQIAHLAAAHVAAFDLDQHSLRLAARVIYKVDDPIDAPVCPLFALFFSP